MGLPLTEEETSIQEMFTEQASGWSRFMRAQAEFEATSARSSSLARPREIHGIDAARSRKRGR